MHVLFSKVGFRGKLFLNIMLLVMLCISKVLKYNTGGECPLLSNLHVTM